MVLTVELNVIEIFAGQGTYGDIVPTVALDSLAQFPTEFTGEMREGSLQILQMENREYHTAGAVAAFSFNFLPHNGPCTDVGGEDEIGKNFDLNKFPIYSRLRSGKDGIPVKGTEVNTADIVQNLVNGFSADKAVLQWLDHLVFAENRAEGDDMSAGHFIGSGKKII